MPLLELVLHYLEKNFLTAKFSDLSPYLPSVAGNWPTMGPALFESNRYIDKCR